MFHTAVKLLPYMKYLTSWRSLRGRDHMVIGLTLPVQSVPITTKVVSLNPTHSEAYSIQHYVAKFLSDLRWFSLGTPVPSTNKTDSHDITKILLKVAVSNISFTYSATRHQSKTAFSTIKSLIGAANSSNTIQLFIYSYVVTYYSWFVSGQCCNFHGINSMRYF